MSAPCTEAACRACRGKDQPSYSPSMDMGGYVIIVNAEKVTVTGNKFNAKLYRSHPTSKPGTLKTETFKQLNEVHYWHQLHTVAHHHPLHQDFILDIYSKHHATSVMCCLLFVTSV